MVVWIRQVEMRLIYPNVVGIFYTSGFFIARIKYSANAYHVDYQRITSFPTNLFF